MYRLAEQDFKQDDVPISRLAQIGALIQLYSCFRNTWTPQALMVDFATMADQADPSGVDRINDVDQAEVDKLLSEGGRGAPDIRAIEEEEEKMRKRRDMEA
ncbi:hypothetical protein HK405_003992 [Cladochytrium tenue]|nr:hypothetical protein HK405_003992 [Cladochytrium tenue]